MYNNRVPLSKIPINQMTNQQINQLNSIHDQKKLLQQAASIFGVNPSGVIKRLEDKSK